jgi:SAM-dependent methyltransferase
MRHDFDIEFLRETIIPLLSPYQADFLEAEFQRGMPRYLERIEYLGLAGMDRVLDAGGGMGQWAIALAALNASVGVIDISSERLLVGSALSARMGVDNVDFRYGSIEAIPYPDASVDAVICYSVLMFADGPAAIREFHRVLRPGGKLYVMVDLWRWPLVNLAPEGPRRLAYTGKFLLWKALKGRPTLYTRSSFEEQLTRNGFRVVRQGQEGHAYFGPAKEVRRDLAFYPEMEAGKEHLWEICAESVAG